jgi:hypothetical protein
MKDKIKTLISKFKEFYSNPYGMLITMSWLLLIVCLIIKLFGGNWFELGSENSKFIQFCNYVETRLYLKMIIGCVIAIITTYPLYCVMLKEQKPKLYKIIPLMILLVIKCIISWYNSIVSFCLDIFILIILMTIFNKNFKRNLKLYIITMIFQIITLKLRDLSFGLNDFNFNNTFIEQFLYQIDYYIIIILIYLYTFKKKKENT